MKLLITSKLSTKLIIGLIFALTVFTISPKLAGAATTGTGDGTACTPTGSSSFLGVLVPWYQYLKSDFYYEGNVCGFQPSIHVKGGGFYNSGGLNASAKTGGLNIVWLIALAVFEDLLRIAGFVAVGFVIYGGIRYTTSQGEPENTKAALDTILNALIGTAIVAIAATVVSFIGNALSVR
ncbi:MAG TPA: hypothetical protein VMR18_03955 [Candidatus Saccharimonadales bacterium]|jgi:hypothetical protein|nr:hypothetical protein [Candidatus Saccharimonadales bacterium]